MSNYLTITEDNEVHEGLPKDNDFLICLDTLAKKVAYPPNDDEFEGDATTAHTQASLNWNDMEDVGDEGKLFAVNDDNDAFYNVSEEDEEGDNNVLDNDFYTILIDTSNEKYLTQDTGVWVDVIKD